MVLRKGAEQGDLLQTVRPVRCLVTSRLVMGLPNLGESRPVGPLAIPARETDRFADFDGYNLFVERARQRQPDFAPADRAALVRVLQATEGFALGIELVAARAMEKTLLELAEGLEQSRLEWQRTCEDLGDLRVDSSRHQSMEACIDWSVGLLPADEQRVFFRLFVFPGDFSAAAAGMNFVSEDSLLRWHRAALVNQTEAGGRMRYTLLPVVREYAKKRVGEDERGAMLFFLSDCITTVNNSLDLNNAEHRATLDAEWRNVLAAVTMAEKEEVWSEVLPLSNLGGFLHLCGLWSKEEHLYERALAAASRLGDRYGEGITLNNLGTVYRDQGKWSQAEEAFQQAQTIQKELGNKRERIDIDELLGIVSQRQIERDEAEKAHLDSLRGTILNNLGSVYQKQGKWDEAEKAYQDSLRIERELGNRDGEWQSLIHLGFVLRERGAYNEAIIFCQQARTICHELGHKHGEGITLLNLRAYPKRHCFQVMRAQAKCSKAR